MKLKRDFTDLVREETLGLQGRKERSPNSRKQNPFIP